MAIEAEISATDTSAAEAAFVIERPSFDTAGATARFSYRLGDLRFTEALRFPAPSDAAAARTPAFEKLLGLTALVLGVSYFKLKAPFAIATDVPLTGAERAFVLDVYENGLGEFYARNNLKRFGRLRVNAPESRANTAAVALPDRALLPIGGGKDSLVSAELLEAAGVDYSPFAVNPKGPILSSVGQMARAPVYVTRTLDPEMIHEVLQVMTELASSGMTMVVVTHEMGFARSVADRIVFMDAGEIVEDASSNAFFTTPRTQRAAEFLSKILAH